MKISKALRNSLWMQRRAHLRWDFAFSENSYGFHAPQESARIIETYQEYARKGQIELINEIRGWLKYGINANS